MTGVDGLLSDADFAMYQAKALGKGRHQVFANGTNGVPVAPTDRTQRWRDRVPHVRRPATATRLEPEAGLIPRPG
jgi:hypothetical protein